MGIFLQAVMAVWRGWQRCITVSYTHLNHDTSLKNCGISYPNDAPDDIELHFNETYRPSGPYGAAGCGEAPLDAPHPAILNAIYNATGARITRCLLYTSCDGDGDFSRCFCFDLQSYR